MHFRILKIGGDSKKVRFYTGFTSMSVLIACFDYLGPAVNNLKYWSSSGGVENLQKSVILAENGDLWRSFSCIS